MRAKTLLAGALLGLAGLLHADSQSFGGQWKGLNNADASILIGDNEAQDLLNVDITDNGSGIRKRSGYSQFQTIGTSTWGVRGAYYYTDTSGNHNVIHANNQSVYKSLNSGDYSAFITTDTAGTYYDFTDSQGYLYRATSDHDQFIRYDGTTLTYYPSNPLGDQVEAMPDRLVMSGVTAYPNRVYFSGAADFTNFTTGLNDTDPFYEQFGLPGQKITAIKYALGRLFAWTGTTLSFWAGSSQFDGTIQDVTTNIGTNQPGSILYDNGLIYWQGNDKHFYSFDGNNIDKISKTISGSVEGFMGEGYKSSIQTTQTDFASGTGYSVSTTDSPGDVVFNENGNLVSDFQSSPFSSWTFITVGAFMYGAWFNNDSIAFWSESGYPLPNPSRSIAYTPLKILLGESIELQIKESDPAYGGLFYIGICTSSVVDYNNFAGCYTSVLNNANYTAYVYKDNSILNSQTYSSGFINESYQDFNLSISTSGLIAIKKGNTLLTNATDTSYNNFNYLFIGYNPNYNSVFAYFDNVYINKSTGTFISSPINIGTAIRSFASCSITNTLPGISSMSFVVYSDSNTAITTTDSATFISSQTITSGEIPTISTGAYLTYQAIFWRSSILENPSLNSFKIEWYDGTITHTYGSVDKNNRLIWSLAENNSTTNNATYIYDQRFQTWLKYSFAMDAPARVGDTTYFGGPSTGVVYYFPSGNSDNGSDITAYWKSKDFIGGDPFSEKDYKNYSLIAKTQTGSNISFEYALNGNTSATSRTISLTNSSGLPFIRNNGLFGNGIVGSFVNFKFGNVGTDLPFEVYSVRYDYSPRAWRVMP